jgi:hypothetical protein
MNKKAIWIMVMFTVLLVWPLGASRTGLAAERIVQITVPDCRA